jgi:hypothetical protein
VFHVNRQMLSGGGGYGVLDGRGKKSIQKFGEETLWNMTTYHNHLTYKDNSWPFK